MEQSTEHTGSVHLHLCVDGQHGVFPVPHCQAGRSRYCFSDPLVEFDIQGRLLEMAKPRYMNSSMTKSVKLPMQMLGVLLSSWSIILVFFRLIGKPNSLKAWAKQLMSRLSTSSE